MPIDTHFMYAEESLVFCTFILDRLTGTCIIYDYTITSMYDYFNYFKAFITCTYILEQ